MPKQKDYTISLNLPDGWTYANSKTHDNSFPRDVGVGTGGDMPFSFTIKEGGPTPAHLSCGAVAPTTSTSATTTTRPPTTTTTLPATTTTGAPTTTSAPMPDLEITPSDITDATYNATSRYYKLSITIKNRGSVDSGLFNTSLITYNSSMNLVNSLGTSYGWMTGDGFQINNIPAGGQITKTYFFNFIDWGNKNNFMLNFTVDFQNQVSESNENNNFVSKNVTVVTTPTTTTTSSSTTTTTSAGLPDLKPDSYVLTNGFYADVPVYAYKKFTTYLNFSVSNLGTGAAGAFDVNVTVSNSTTYYGDNIWKNISWYIGKTRINSLAAGATIYLSFNVTNATKANDFGAYEGNVNPAAKIHPGLYNCKDRPCQEYYANITVDPLNEVSELDENNNKNSTKFRWNITHSCTLTDYRNCYINSAPYYGVIPNMPLQFVGSSPSPMG